MPSSYRTELREGTTYSNPPSNPPSRSTPLSSHSYSYVTMFTICAQAAGLIAAYFIGITYHYDSLIRTHCRVPNFWPSISKCTGDYLPGRYIWRLAISLTTFPRLIDTLVYYNFFAARRPTLFQGKWWYRWLNRLNCILMIVELFLFYTVTFVSSRENMGIHIYAWMAFLGFSLAHMVTFLILFGYPMVQKTQCHTQSEKISMSVRCIMFGIQVISVITFFHYATRHEWHCQPYAFSYGGISECVIAASNLGFQTMQLLDFKNIKSVHHWDDNDEPLQGIKSE